MKIVLVPFHDSYTNVGIIPPVEFWTTGNGSRIAAGLDQGDRVLEFKSDQLVASLEALLAVVKKDKS